MSETEVEMLTEDELYVGDFGMPENERAAENADARIEVSAENGPSAERAPDDSVAHYLTERMGGTSHDWQLVQESRGYVFDGKEIYNPLTGENYWGTVERTEEHEQLHQEMIQLWNDGLLTLEAKEIIFQLPDHKESTPEGDRLFVTVLILEADRSVRYEIRENFIPRAAEEYFTPVFDSLLHEKEDAGTGQTAATDPLSAPRVSPTIEAASLAAYAAGQDEYENGTSEGMLVGDDPLETNDGADRLSLAIEHTHIQDAPRIPTATVGGEDRAPAVQTYAHEQLGIADALRADARDETHERAPDLTNSRISEWAYPRAAREDVSSRNAEQANARAALLLREAHLFAVIETEGTAPYAPNSAIETLRDDTTPHLAAETFPHFAPERADSGTSQEIVDSSAASRSSDESPFHIPFLEAFLKDAPAERILSGVEGDASRHESIDERTSNVRAADRSPLTPPSAEGGTVRETKEASPERSRPPEKQGTSFARVWSKTDHERRAAPPSRERQYAEAVSHLKPSPLPAKDTGPHKPERVQKLNGITLRRSA